MLTIILTSLLTSFVFIFILMTVFHGRSLIYIARFEEKSKIFLPPNSKNVLRNGISIRLLRMVFKLLNENYPEEEILKKIFEKISSVYKASGWSFLLTPENKEWSFYVWCKKYDKFELEKLARELNEKKPDNLKKILDTKKIYALQNVHKFSRWVDSEKLSAKISTWIGIPIVFKNSVMGILNIDWSHRKRLNSFHLSLAEVLATELSNIVTHVLHIKQLILDANLDILTETLNRRALENFKNIAGQSAVLFIDLNDFKKINDKYGHELGDKTLKIIAERLKRVIKKEDLIFRYGGDEFVVILKDIDDEEIIKSIVTRIKKIIEIPITIDMSSFRVSAAIGYVLNSKTTSIKELIDLADKKMYMDKRQR
ncbi:GGDEF domain-containing protein [Thermosipho ferrireducens]|uniref:GGDEF domain-containing protein n=1 Tax=Thermosipho ferrireducens TaxID=2571116 RepID=A0ABX7S6Z5_9BACT|nr:sensor domain-containing diguanylate cyclase [Thermosipho ferrireducens]QTA38367.1 GGDEF domain-containing protein [Thermosipho ferrireducens]